MVEAAGFSSITAEALKYAAGRERPDQTTPTPITGAMRAVHSRPCTRDRSVRRGHRVR